MKKGKEQILDERQRQIASEGWTPEHDDRHDHQQLQRAAECYFLSAEMYLKGFKSFRPPATWPWDEQWWKPSTPERDLVKAGALWLAEIDRMKRLDPKDRFPTILTNLAWHVEKCANQIDRLQSL